MVMRLRRCYVVVFIIIICATGILKFCYFNSLPEKYTTRSVVTINPSSKRHWFRLKITHKNENPTDHPVKRILLWTPFFGETDYVPPLEKLYCEFKNCLVTSNRSYLSQSDALIFHVRDIKVNDMPLIKPDFQRWVLLHHEAPPYTPLIFKRLEGLFNWTATYRLDSDIVLTPQVIKLTKPIKKSIPDIALTKSRMVAWFVSNCNTHSHREDYVRQLQKSISVDVYGDCGNKVCLPKMSNECYEKISSEYRYYLGFENSLCKDYVTEKFFNILYKTNMIPIVLGGANYSEIAPPHSYIDALSFRSPRELAHFLLILAKDAKRYNSYFEWRNFYKTKSTPYACTICKKLNEQSKPSWKENLRDWWFTEAKCKVWPMDFV